MKRFSGLIIASVVLALLCASVSFATPVMLKSPRWYIPFPAITFGTNSAVGNGTAGICLQHGWSLGTAAWYACFATNDIRTAQTSPNPRDGRGFGITLAPKLTSAIGNGAQQMWIVTNFNNQGPVFAITPLNDTNLYTGLWEVTYITWHSDVTPWVITNPDANIGVPPGLPSHQQADYSFFPPTVTPGPFSQHTVIDCPIFAVGSISNPWNKPSTLSPPVYRIPQGIKLEFEGSCRELTIPTWNVFCQDDVTHRVHVREVVIPDVSTLDLAMLTGANYAPNLFRMPCSDRSKMYVINWMQNVATPPAFAPLKVLQGQFPVLDQCPTDCASNTNFEYSPVDTFILLNRDLSLISPEVLFNNVPFIQAQIARGALIKVGGCPICPCGPAVNAPVLCEDAGDL